MEGTGDQDSSSSPGIASNKVMLKKFVPPRPMTTTTSEKPVAASSSSRSEPYKPPASAQFKAPVATSTLPKGQQSHNPAKPEDDKTHRAYTCFYTDQWRKKKPIFKDGYLRIKGRSAELFRDDGTPSTKTHKFEEFIDDNDTPCGYIGSFLVQLDMLLPYQDLDSGKCFLGNYQIPKPAPALVAAGGTKDLSMPVLPKFRGHTAPKKLGISDVGEPEVQPQKTLPSSENSGISTPMKSDSNSIMLKKFRNPADLSNLPEESTKAYVLCSADTHPGRVTHKCFIDEFLMDLLMPHQIKGIQFMFECLTGLGKSNVASGCILGDSMGLGKTLQVVGLIWILLRQNPFVKEPLAKKVLVVCPVSLVHNWRNEVLNWLGEKKLYPLVADGTEQPQDILTKFSKDSYRCCIISYEALSSYNQYLTCAIDVVFCDEGHRLKNTDIKIYKILNGLRVNKKVLITGTPIQNNLMELFACISFVDSLIFKSEKSFKRLFAEPISRGLVKQAPLQVLRESREKAKELMHIVANIMIRRTNKILEEFLPPRKEYIVYLNASQQQLAEYNKLLDSYRKAGVMSGISHDSMFSLLAQIRRILLCPGEGTVTTPRTSCKIAFLGEILRDTTYKSKLIIVSYYTGVLDQVEGYLQEQGMDWARLDGTLGQKERTKSIEKFASPGCNVFLLAAKAGGTGLNLVMANRMVLLDVDWNPSNDAQVMGRVYRKGQTRPVEIFRLVVAGTVEEKIMERQISKVDLSNLVADSLEASARFTADELRELFNISKGFVGKFARNKKNVKNEMLKLKVCRAMERLIQWVIVDKEEELTDLAKPSDNAEDADLEHSEGLPKNSIIPEVQENDDESEEDIPEDSPALLFESFDSIIQKQIPNVPLRQVLEQISENPTHESQENVDHQSEFQENQQHHQVLASPREEVHKPEVIERTELQSTARPSTEVLKSSRSSKDVADILKEVEDMFN